jgi:hypothetical protein
VCQSWYEDFRSCMVIEIKWFSDACALDRSFTLLAVTWCYRFLITSLFSLCATLQQVPSAAGGRGQCELCGALLTRDERALDGRRRVPALLWGKLIVVPALRLRECSGGNGLRSFCAQLLPDLLRAEMCYISLVLVTNPLPVLLSAGQRQVPDAVAPHHGRRR